jgi:hypothetical protein
MPPLKKAQQEKFVLAWFSGKTLEQAAIEAGYSPKWARSIGSRLSTNANIKARYEELQKKAEDAAVTTVLERLKILSEIERATIGDFADENGNLLDRPNLKSAAVQEIRTERTLAGVRTTLKLRDPVSAIAEHNKMDGAYAPTKTEVTGKDGKELNTLPPIIHVASPEAKNLTDKIISGEGTD